MQKVETEEQKQRSEGRESQIIEWHTKRSFYLVTCELQEHRESWHRKNEAYVKVDKETGIKRGRKVYQNVVF